MMVERDGPTLFIHLGRIEALKLRVILMDVMSEWAQDFAEAIIRKYPELDEGEKNG